jgi:hypothetical protein
LPVPVLIVVSRIIGVVILIFSFYFSSCFIHPNMSAATTKGVIDWIARWHEATVEYPMNNEGASEQMLVDDESWLIYKYPSKLGDINAY